MAALGHLKWHCDVSRLGGSSGYRSPVIWTRLLLHAFTGCSGWLWIFIHWDVVNENLHFNFFEEKLGNQASRMFYSTANRIDGRATPFLNDYNTIEDSRDGASSPASPQQR
ncbi:endo-1 4-beta-xylanase [Striga asiatica]|uniref:Endo-1 4-beta-xylanase n=1 Tax=Striga asiatica TaxID=4170 RepID=A0A5A7PC00_STRAF|nr:endo-1 4-beta-xylanase [Striga asiatica]